MRRLFFFGLLAIVMAAGVVCSAYAQTKDKHDRRVIILNERSSDMMRLYASRTTTGDWEENILASPIRAGSQLLINFDDGTGACTFDFRAIFKDNLSAHMWNINVCRESYWRVVD